MDMPRQGGLARAVSAKHGNKFLTEMVTDISLMAGKEIPAVSRQAKWTLSNCTKAGIVMIVTCWIFNQMPT